MDEKERLEKLFNSLTEEEKDYIYRSQWKRHVALDVCDEIDLYRDGPHAEGELDDISKFIAEKYVDEGEYDCNLSYWDNIYNLVDKYLEEGGYE